MQLNSNNSKAKWSLNRINKPRFIPNILNASVMAAFISPAHALNWELDNGVTVDLDTSVTYDAQWRQEDRSSAIDSGGGNPLLSLVTDDGNENFDKGDMTQNRISFSSDLDVNYGNGGAFLRFRGWYDEVYDDSSLTGGKSYQKDGLDDHKADVEMLDSFLYHNFYLGDRTLSIRVGDQVVNWGESMFLGGGISSAQGPVDATRSNAPGVELKDIFMPLGQVYAGLDITDTLSMGAYYQYDWKETRIDSPGSYFSILDALGQGSVGDVGDTTAIIGVQAPVKETTPDHGQYGLALRYMAESLNNTEFGLYYLRYNDFLPALQFDLGPAFMGNPGAVHVNHEYFEDIDLVGFSFGTVIGDTNISGEISHRDGQAVQLAYPAGFKFARAKTMQAQVSVIHSFGDTPIADNLTLTGELGYNRVLDIDGVSGSVKDALDNDRSAAGVVTRLKANYYNVANGLDMSISGTYRNDFDGVSSVPFTFTEDVEKLSLKADFTYLNTHNFGANYVWYLTDAEEIVSDTGKLELGHLNADRDYFAMYYKYRF